MLQGCYDNTGITALLFATRTARAYQVAFGGCTGTYFWEDAPAGGYLAGLAGISVDPTLATYQPSMGEWQFMQGINTQFPVNPWLKQVRSTSLACQAHTGEGVGYVGVPAFCARRAAGSRGPTRWKSLGWC